MQSATVPHRYFTPHHKIFPLVRDVEPEYTTHPDADRLVRDLGYKNLLEQLCAKVDFPPSLPLSEKKKK
ncbi:hypothetical protein SCP_1402400 [Sparassis crispa]|uniref:Uncharacterized protein n=1 Tax=Sparassis crispa TaxID=139825 RepID=A0A401H355_9APHY|nr:hypothetical protein SCP_1402400 [Sparassis crispa]GBE88833.1 hypothetical protein SCP_1402400 [Sparassis crispa]